MPAVSYQQAFFVNYAPNFDEWQLDNNVQNLSILKKFDGLKLLARLTIITAINGDTSCL